MQSDCRQHFIGNPRQWSLSMSRHVLSWSRLICNRKQTKLGIDCNKGLGAHTCLMAWFSLVVFPEIFTSFTKFFPFSCSIWCSRSCTKCWYMIVNLLVSQRYLKSWNFLTFVSSSSVLLFGWRVRNTYSMRPVPMLLFTGICFNSRKNDPNWELELDPCSCLAQTQYSTWLRLTLRLCRRHDCTMYSTDSLNLYSNGGRLVIWWRGQRIELIQNNFSCAKSDESHIFIPHLPHLPHLS